MVKHIDTHNTIDLLTETHYALLSTVDSQEYPQVHDFYELILVLEGSLTLEVNITPFVLPPGTLFLIRPHDIHTKCIEDHCLHINLAFPKQTVDNLFCYLDLMQWKQAFIDAPFIRPVYLTPSQKNHLKEEIEKLNLLPLNQKHLIKVHLRAVIMHILTNYFILHQEATLQDKEQYPEWFKLYLLEVQKKEVFTQSNEVLLNLANKSQEHLCRTFKKHLNLTPTQYFNELRLNYSANLLLHTDQPIIDVAYNTGFQSLSYFYHVFHKKYKTSPYKFRKNAPQHA